MDEKDRLEIIKDILFTDDREYIEKISERIALLEKTVNEQERLSSKVDPIIENQLEEFTKSIPTTLGPTITETLREQIRTQRDEVVDALFPILGKMIKKYIAQEIKALSEKIDSQFDFISKWKIRLRALFSGKKKKELLLQQLSSAKIEQVLLIEKDSGILKASYSKTKTIDEEMVSGMLTAIKSFVEDAFNQQNQNLELIEYELYQIHLQSFVTHYMAVVISGPYGLKSKNKLQDLIFDFYNRYMAMNVDLVVDFPILEKKTKKADKRTIEKELASSFGNAKI
ncbi:cell envelope biogenesis protein OmpA [Allomuricauda sp. SCSIO 65647]|uniref:cell envelope biogenesis protein OmpA n=1 Tax=Allomuricauda sp. SCSIO 65647 TaxID=2908843 RepID=UPI001F3F1E35|nr:cell envelope biogenesis protein OmpA [Muricauda sp. SCSIO 65647]UJH69152.1 cell envelope biogenesis protein OmpA [Muricauda sp. SCSIO 65647]